MENAHGVSGIVIVLQLVYQELSDNCWTFAICESDLRDGFNDCLVKRGISSSVNAVCALKYSLSARSTLRYQRSYSALARTSG
jgi:hypothetical protein